MLMSLDFDTPFGDVEWEDTDVSEDEDFLPSKELCTSVGSNNDFEELFHKRKQENETPYDVVRRVVDQVVDNGTERVDLGHIGLTEVPGELADLAYVTVLCKDVIKTASLQLYLYNNQLSSLNSSLFRLKNLTVLSLRTNCLSAIPPDICLLENLVELSLGNNQLKTLPAELQRLKKLTTLSLFPNPYLTQDATEDTHQVFLPSLVEICHRTLLYHSSPFPFILPDTVYSLSKPSTCEHCHSPYYSPTVQSIRWVSLLGNQPVPLVYRFCSTHCSYSSH